MTKKEMQQQKCHHRLPARSRRAGKWRGAGGGRGRDRGAAGGAGRGAGRRAGWRAGGDGGAPTVAEHPRGPTHTARRSTACGGRGERGRPPCSAAAAAVPADVPAGAEHRRRRRRGRRRRGRRRRRARAGGRVGDRPDPPAWGWVQRGGGWCGRADGWATAQIPPRGGGCRGVAVGAGAGGWVRDRPDPPPAGGVQRGGGWCGRADGWATAQIPPRGACGGGAEGCRSATVAPKRAGLQPTVLIGGAPQALKSKGVGARSLVRILNTRQDAEPPPHDILVVSQWIDWRVTLKRPVAGSRQPGQARIRNKPCGQGPLGTAL